MRLGSPFKILLAAYALFQTCALAQSPPLQVGVSDLPPFAFQSGGQWDGAAVTLWREVADDLGVVFEFTATEPDALVAAVADGTLDLGITGTATSEDEATVDFSYPYYTAALSVATPRTQSLWNTVKGLFTARFFRIVLALTVLLLIVGTLVWLLERGSNEESFGGERGVLQGVGAGFWWAAVTMTTIGYGDKAPVTFWGRAVAFFWMLLALALTASLTAALVSVVGAGSGNLSVPGDLRELRVGVAADTPAATYLREEGVEPQEFDTVLVSLRALQRGDLDAVLANDATLRYLKSENSSLSFQRTETNAQPQRYAFVLPQDDAVQANLTRASLDRALDRESLNRENLNRALLTRLNAQPWGRLLERYLPKE